MTNPTSPELCGQRLSTLPTEYACRLAAGHRSAFHLDIHSMATWSSARDLVHHGDATRALERIEAAVTVPADGTCGASLVFSPTGRAYTCALQMGHAVTSHHDVRENARWSAMAHPVPTPPTPSTNPVMRSALTGFERALGSMTEVWRELLNATCTGCREVAAYSAPDAPSAELEVAEGCPVHGEVAELRRQVEWATQLHDQFCAALGPEYVGPFSADPTPSILRSIETARGIDRVLREAGIDYPLGLRGVADLASLHEGALERVEELERHAGIVRDLVAEALPNAELVQSSPLPDVVNQLVEEYRSVRRALEEYR